MELDYIAIGIRIRRYRKEKGMTQQLLAELSHQEPSNISHIERGATKLSLPTLVNIANALSVTVDDILCDSIEAAKPSYEKHLHSLIDDCSHQELRILLDTMIAMKDSMRRNFHKQ